MTALGKYLNGGITIAMSLLCAQGVHAGIAWVMPVDASSPASGGMVQQVGGAVIVSASATPLRVTRAPSGAGRRPNSLAVADRAMGDCNALSAARTAGVDPHLVKAVAWAESAFRADAVSPKGAMGVMQLMPATAIQYGVDDPFDAVQSLQGGSRLLRDLLQRYGGEIPLALAAYNAGPGAVDRAGRRIPNYPETQAYVGRVLGAYERLRGPAVDSSDANSAISTPTTIWVSEYRALRTAPGTAALTRAFGNAWVFDAPARARRTSVASAKGVSL